MLKFPQLTTVDNFTIVKSGGALKLADRIELNIDYIAFCRCIDLGVTKYNLAGGMMDAYQDQTGINTGSCLNQTYDAVNDLYSPTLLGDIDSYAKLVIQNNIVPESPLKAIYFDGAGDYLTVADHADWDFGTGEYTIECWINWTVNQNTIFYNRGTNNHSASFYLNALYISYTAYDAIIRSFTPVLNRWYHIAWERIAGNLRIYVDGVQQGAQVADATNVSFALAVYIGSYQGTSNFFAGRLKEMRVSNIGRYSADFAPSRTFTADSNTKLLLHADEAVGATTFIDSETTPKTVSTTGQCVITLNTPLMESIFLDTEITAKTITTVGAAKQIPYMLNKSAAWFDGTNTSTVNISHHSDFGFSGDFTIEVWLNFHNKTGFRGIYSKYQATSQGMIWGYSTNLVLYFNSSSTSKTWTWDPLLFTWYHVALVRSAGVFNCYINGVVIGTSYSDANALTNPAVPVVIGNDNVNDGNFFGWMKELRISNSARYITTFAPNTTQFTTDANTKLLLHFDTPATAPLCPAIRLDNVTGDYLMVADSTDFNFGTGDVTIETFFNRVGASTYYHVLYMRYNGTTSGIFFDATETNIALYLNSTTALKTWTLSMPVNTWHHVALVRSSGVWQLYFDGIGQGTASYSSSFDYTAPLYIGFNGSNSYNNCYLREYRVSNEARYTANFTPSQAEFTVDSNTKLYIKGDGDNGTGGTIVPAMTSNSLPSPCVALASTEYSGTYMAWNAFDKSSSTYWATSAGVVTGWLKIDLGTAYAIEGYSLYGVTVHSPKDWTFQGSNDNSAWTVLDTRTGEYPQTPTTYRFATTAIAYRYYKIDVTAVNSGGTVVSIYQLNLLKTIKDSSTNTKTITGYGDAKVKYTEDYRNTIFLDSETTPKYPYPIGSAKIDFIAPFGTGVGYWNGGTTYLSLADSADWDFDGDFTIDFWAKWNVIGHTNLMGNSYPTGWAIQYNSAGNLYLYAVNAARLTTTFTATVNTWYHISLVRYSGTVKFYVNGTALSAGAAFATAITSASALQIGAETSYAGYYHNGFMDNIRISKGIARYTATFNPPSAELLPLYYGNMTLQSAAFSTTLTPNDNRVILYEEDVDAITLNTDIKAYASRDNGTTWNQITLTNAGYYSGTRRILSGVADISMQPVVSSYNMIYKVTTLNNKALKLRGAGMNWG